MHFSEWISFVIQGEYARVLNMVTFCNVKVSFGLFGINWFSSGKTGYPNEAFSL
jgi:hypothetical protein